MRRLLTAFGLLASIAAAQAQNTRIPINVPFTKLFALQQQPNAFSFIGNPAALARQEHFAAGVYSERRFLLSELSQHQVALAMPSRFGNFGLRGDYFGNTWYNEAGAGLTYARTLSAGIDVGVKFNYYGVNVPSYGHAGAINAEVGVIVHFTEQMRAGIHVYNPSSVELGKNGEEQLPSIYAMSVGYDLSEQLFLTASIEKVQGKPASVLAGLQYKFNQRLVANVGLASATSTYTMGLGVQLKSFQLTTVASLHPQLGLTPGLMLLFGKTRSHD